MGDLDLSRVYVERLCVSSQKTCVKQATLCFLNLNLHFDFAVLVSVLHMIPQSNYGNSSAVAVFCRSLSIRSQYIHSHSAPMEDIWHPDHLTGQ